MDENAQYLRALDSMDVDCLVKERREVQSKVCVLNMPREEARVCSGSVQRICYSMGNLVEMALQVKEEMHSPLNNFCSPLQANEGGGWSQHDSGCDSNEMTKNYRNGIILHCGAQLCQWYAVLRSSCCNPLTMPTKMHCMPN